MYIIHTYRYRYIYIKHTVPIGRAHAVLSDKVRHFERACKFLPTLRQQHLALQQHRHTPRAIGAFMH